MSEDFFGDLGRSITRATQRAVGRTGSLIETTKLNAQITGEQKELEYLYGILGEWAYDLISKGKLVPDEAAKDLASDIGVRREKLSELREDLAGLRGMKLCPYCSGEIEKDAQFCPKCGRMLSGEAVKAEEEEEQETAETKTVIVETAEIVAAALSGDDDEPDPSSDEEEKDNV
ncbi:MAG: zinc ribbon domain-containing protein [Lachnospiraceae bacterium]|nr:zinc ribbon domain-containing protein [Lachnospiraceae bacterium]